MGERELDDDEIVTAHRQRERSTIKEGTGEECLILQDAGVGTLLVVDELLLVHDQVRVTACLLVRSTFQTRRHYFLGR